MTVKQIPLTQGYVALVDDADYDDLMQFKWHAHVRPHTVYARRTVRLGGDRKTEELMHRHLLPSAVQVDHINHDGLDNRRTNLRPATHAENRRNQSGLAAHNTSGFRGVYWNKQRRKWQSYIRVDGRPRHLGFFTDPTDAGRAFDAAALEHYGEYAGYLNFGWAP